MKPLVAAPSRASPSLDRGNRVRAAVEADDNQLLQPCRLQRRHRAERHRIVAGDDALDVAIALNHRLHLLKCFPLIPVGALPRDHLQIGVLIEHVVIAAAAHRRVCVRLTPDQFNVIAGFAHQPDELLGTERRALVVVRYDLRRGRAGGVDLPIDEDARDAGCLCLVHRGNRGVRTGIVEDDRRHLPRDRDVIQLVLLVRIVVVRVDEDLVAERPGTFRRSLRFRLEKGIVVRGSDDRDALAARGCIGGGPSRRAACHRTPRGDG